MWIPLPSTELLRILNIIKVSIITLLIYCVSKAWCTISTYWVPKPTQLSKLSLNLRYHFWFQSIYLQFDIDVAKLFLKLSLENLTWDLSCLPKIASWLTQINPYFSQCSCIFPELQIRVCTGKLVSLFLMQNICCGYSKNSLDETEHPKHMFKLIGKKIITNFTLIKFPYLDLCLYAHFNKQFYPCTA